MESLTVIVGAGASIPLGVPDTLRATERVLALDDDPGLLDLNRRGECELPFRRLHALLSRVYSPPNFEHLLHALEAVDGLRNGRYVLERWLTNGLTDEIRALFPEKASASFSAGVLIDELHQTFADATRAVLGHTQWPAFYDFWQQLSARYRLDIVTLNYDTSIDGACPSLEQGFRSIAGQSAERFDPSAFLNHPGVPRLMHLHGSVQLGRPALDSERARFAFEDRWGDLYRYSSPEEARQANRGSSTNSESQAGRTNIVGHLITGLQKTDKLIAAQPYLSYYQAAGQALSSTPRLLIIGYGFSDLHINAWLDRMGRLHGERLRLSIIDFCGVWGETDYRLAPGWAKTSAVLHCTGTASYWECFPNGLIQADPWTSKNGLCRLDLRGFLGSVGQASEVLAFLERA